MMCKQAASDDALCAFFFFFPAKGSVVSDNATGLKVLRLWQLEFQ